MMKLQRRRRRSAKTLGQASGTPLDGYGRH
jgi:hypothetical protein